MARIRDRSTLDAKIVVHAGTYDVSFNSEVGTASWADSRPPFAVHTGGTIRINGYLAQPGFGGPYPAIVIGHGHGGEGSRDLAIAIAALGYVALSIDGPMAGGSTGGPEDTEQAWISVENASGQLTPNMSYLWHYATAGMRALTLLDSLSRLPFNPIRIDRNRLGVLGASMGGMWTYYINGVDNRVKSAVAISVAGDFNNLFRYPGNWLYHGLFYYTRDGIPSGIDQLNTISDVCRDPTAKAFTDYFDPINYAPVQHAPLLTIMGTHDQFFSVPGINTTYDRVASAGSNPRFIKRILFGTNGKHAVLEGDPLATLGNVITSVQRWFDYSFKSGAMPPPTPTVTMTATGNAMVFRIKAPPGGRPLRSVRLQVASELNTLPEQPCNFTEFPVTAQGNDDYVGTVAIGALPRCGAPITPANALYFATVEDSSDMPVSSKMYYRSGELAFGSGFQPVIEHPPVDDFPVPPAPAACP